MSYLLAPSTITNSRLGGFYSDGKYLLSFTEDESAGSFVGEFYKGTSQSDDYIGIEGSFDFQKTRTEVCFRLLGASVSLYTDGPRKFKTLYLGFGVISAGIGNFDKVDAGGNIGYSRGSHFKMDTVYRTDCLKYLEIVKSDADNGTFQGTFVDYNNGVALENIVGRFEFFWAEGLTKLSFKTSKNTWELQAVMSKGKPCFSDWAAVSDAGEQVTFYKDYIPQ